MKLSIILLVSLGCIAITFNLSEAVQYNKASIGRFGRINKSANRQRNIEVSDQHGEDSHIVVKEDPPKRNDGQYVIAALLDAFPQLESSLQSTENRVDYPQAGNYGQYDQYFPVGNPLKALLAKLAYGLPVLLGYFKVFTYLNQLCNQNAVCTNITVTATSTLTDSATSTATAVSVTFSTRVRLYTTTLHETTTSTSMPTTTTTFTETATTSTTSSRTLTNTITSTTLQTATSTSTSTTTSITVTTNTILTITTTSTMLNNPGRFMEIFGDDDEELFNFDYRPTFRIEKSASPVIGDSGEPINELMDGTTEHVEYEDQEIEEEWTDYDTALLSPTSTVVELSSSIQSSDPN